MSVVGLAEQGAATGGIGFLARRAGLGLRAGALALLLGVSAIGFGAGGVLAQGTVPENGTAPAGDTAPAAAPDAPAEAPSEPPAAPARPAAIAEALPWDNAAWDALAARAETLLADAGTSSDQLERLRGNLVDWRATLLEGQKANATRIATVREQIAALGAAPADGADEAPEIAQRRSELAAQLVTLEAPGIAAVEGYRRADGLIREIDTKVRAQQTDRILELSPAPINPANWPEALQGLQQTSERMWNEVANNIKRPFAQARLIDNLPIILMLLAVFIATTFFVRSWIEAFADRLRLGAGARRRVLAFVLSLGQIVVPTIGMMALSRALIATAMLGPTTRALAEALPLMGLVIYGSLWIGGRIFALDQREIDDEAGAASGTPESDDAPAAPEGTVAALAEQALPRALRIEARFHALLMGVVLVAEAIRAITMDGRDLLPEAISVASFPILCVGAFLLWRMGRIMHVLRAGADKNYVLTLIGLAARLVRVIAVVGPLLAAFGYVEAAKSMIYPAILTLALLGLLVLLQRFLADLSAMIMRTPEGNESDGLVPVLLGFALALASVPLLVLIWGARVSDLTEVWTRFSEGFQFGDTRISPADFAVFALIFALGYLATRLFQGALRNTILPRTTMEKGGQNALVSGTGYLGIFLAALVAINATGIDLSGLAIVASALSVGIGFGLQNIVQNFVSGVILMIERPVSEGDWIEVGTTQGIVRSISVRSTRIQTFDRNVVVVPNADLVSQRVTNWTRFSLSGRLTVPVTVAGDSDPAHVERVLQDIAEAEPMAILNPPPQVLLQSITGGLTFEIRLILRDVNFGTSVRSSVNHAIIRRFREENIRMPSTSAEIRLANVDELGEALFPNSDSAVEHPALRAGQPPLDADASGGRMGTERG